MTVMRRLPAHAVGLRRTFPWEARQTFPPLQMPLEVQGQIPPRLVNDEIAVYAGYPIRLFHPNASFLAIPSFKSSDANRAKGRNIPMPHRW